MKNRLSTLVLVLLLSALALSGCRPEAVQPTELPTATPAQAVTEVPATVQPTEVPTATPTEVVIEPQEAARDETADWQTYRNEKYGYSFKYFADCYYGPMPAGCKKVPPAERAPECLCFLNGEDPDRVCLQAFLGDLDQPTGFVFWVSHPETPAFNPRPGADLVEWMKEAWPGYEDTPDEPNMRLGGIPAVRYYRPQSQMAPSWEKIYFMIDGKLFEISMVSMDEGNNRELYDQMLSSFSTFEVVTEEPAEVRAARDTALAYVIEHYGTQAPASDLTWAVERITPEGLIGSETFRYTADGWVVTVSYPMVAPDAVIYQIVVANQATWFRWEGEVDAAGQVTEQLASIGEQALVACYGHVVKLPDKYPFDDFLSSAGAGDFGLVGANAEVEAAIEALRDKEEPGKYAHFWGTISCGVDDYGTCQFVVSRLRPDAIGPFFDPDLVEGWEGTIVSNPPMAQYDDYFVLAGDFPLEYGIDSSDAALAAQLADLRDTRTGVRVWGQLYAGVMDVNGARIDVTRLEILQKPPALPAPADWASYVNADYGFAFRYPATWLLEEVPAWEDDRGKFAPSVKLSQGTLTLVIGYKRVTDDVIIEGGGAAGDLIPRGSVTFVGQELRRRALVYEGKDKAVYYGGLAASTQADDLIFGISLHDFAPDYQAVDIPEALQAEADRIVESFELVPVVPVDTSTVVGWCGLVVGLPEGAQFNDYLALQPEGAGEIGLTGADAAIEAEIEALRDSGSYANFWGTLTCHVPAYGGCELVVTRVDPGGPPGPLFDPDPVEGWEGQVFSVPGLAQFDDYFILRGPFLVTFGIAGTGVEDLRDTSATVRIWGEIQCGIPDVCGCSITVDRYEVVSEESPKLGSHVESPVDGWYGCVIGLPADARYDDYLSLLPVASGDVGLTGIDAATEAEIERLRTSGTPAHFWGTITCGVPDYDGCRITVTRILPEGEVSSPEPPSSWAGRYFFGAGLGEFDDCLILAGPFGVRYGLEAANDRVAAALEELRKIDKLVGPVPDIRIWGEMQCGVPDVNGCRILVEHLEELFDRQ